MYKGGVGGWVGAMLCEVYIFMSFCCLGVEQTNCVFISGVLKQQRLLAEKLKGEKLCGCEVDSGLQGNTISLGS